MARIVNDANWDAQPITRGRRRFHTTYKLSRFRSTKAAESDLSQATKGAINTQASQAITDKTSAERSAEEIETSQAAEARGIVNFAP